MRLNDGGLFRLAQDLKQIIVTDEIESTVINRTIRLKFLVLDESTNKPRHRRTLCLEKLRKRLLTAL